MELATRWPELEPAWRICFELAWTAYGADTIPVGAVLVDADGGVVSTGRNGVYDREGMGLLMSGSLLAHAEVNALARLDPERRYENHVMYSSLEPCLLCAGAAAMATVGTIRYAGGDPYAGAGHLAVTNPHIGRLDFSIEGPLEDGFGLLAAALHVEFYLRRNPEGRVVSVHRERAQDVYDAATRLHDLACYEIARNDSLESSLNAISPCLNA